MCTFQNNVLTIGDKKINLECPIEQLTKFDNCVVALLKNEELPNNIIAYNFEGIKLWKINDILKIERPGNFTELEKVSGNILGVYYAWGIYYEIDLNKKEVIKKEYTR